MGVRGDIFYLRSQYNMALIRIQREKQKHKFEVIPVRIHKDYPAITVKMQAIALLYLLQRNIRDLMYSKYNSIAL